MEVGQRRVEQRGGAAAHATRGELLDGLVHGRTCIRVISFAVLCKEVKLLASAWMSLVPVPPVVVRLCHRRASAPSFLLRFTELVYMIPVDIVPRVSAGRLVIGI